MPGFSTIPEVENLRGEESIHSKKADRLVSFFSEGFNVGRVRLSGFENQKGIWPFHG